VIIGAPPVGRIESETRFQVPPDIFQPEHLAIESVHPPENEKQSLLITRLKKKQRFDNY
jgi:hypothetical protein